MVDFRDVANPQEPHFGPGFLMRQHGIDEAEPQNEEPQNLAMANIMNAMNLNAQPAQQASVVRYPDNIPPPPREPINWK